jgi:hypothetical protein
VRSISAVCRRPPNLGQGRAAAEPALMHAGRSLAVAVDDAGS